MKGKNGNVRAVLRFALKWAEGVSIYLLLLKLSSFKKNQVSSSWNIETRKYFFFKLSKT